MLERTIGALRAAGVLVLADAKRGDIGSTMAAYADAWAGDSPLAADAVTASPYLGFGSLQPLLDTATAHGRGVFVLAATSNPEGASVQRADAGGRTVAQSIVDAAAAVNRESSPEPGSVGVVVGATCPTRPTSAHWAVRCWCRASARRADGPRRSAALAGLMPGSCCPRCHARCCGPDPRSPPCAPRLSASVMRWRIWRELTACDASDWVEVANPDAEEPEKPQLLKSGLKIGVTQLPAVVERLVIAPAVIDAAPALIGSAAVAGRIVVRRSTAPARPTRRPPGRVPARPGRTLVAVAAIAWSCRPVHRDHAGPWQLPNWQGTGPRLRRLRPHVPTAGPTRRSPTAIA